MSLISSEQELERKRLYYIKNKDKILAKKHERKDIIYQNKIARKLNSPEEYEKEMMRKFSQQEERENPGKCEMCETPELDLDHVLEKHHDDYTSTKVWFLCKPCHASADSYRRRKV